MRYNREVQQSNRGMVMVVGGGALLGLVLALGYVFYWSPKLKAEAAQDEVRLWGEHWQAARACLLGQDPKSSNVREALLVREILEADLKGSLQECVSKLKVLGREDGASSENMAIEKAWYELRVPIGKVAQEHAWRTARTPNKSEKKLRLNLATAIAGLDESYAALRAAAKLSVETAAGKELAKTTAYLRLGGPKNPEAKVRDLRLSSKAITYNVQDGESRHRAKLVSGAEGPSFSALSPLALRAVDGDWGLWVEEDGIPLQDEYANEGAAIVSGPLDDLGEPAGDGTLLHTLAKGEKVQLRFATGKENRSALFQLLQVDDFGGFSWSYRLLASTNAGQSWTPRALPRGEMWPSLKETGAASYIVYTDAEDSMTLHLMTLSDAGIIENRVAFPGTLGSDDTWPPDQCLADNRPWWILAGTLYTTDPEGKLVSVPGKLEQDPDHYAYQFLCDDTYAGVHAQPYSQSERNLQYQACTMEGCDAPAMTKAHTSDASVHHLFHKGSWLSVQELDGVVALWRGEAKKPERLLRLQAEGTLQGVLAWGDAILFVVWGDQAPGPSLEVAE